MRLFLLPHPFDQIQRRTALAARLKRRNCSYCIAHLHVSILTCLDIRVQHLHQCPIEIGHSAISSSEINPHHNHFLYLNPVKRRQLLNVIYIWAFIGLFPYRTTFSGPATPSPLGAMPSNIQFSPSAPIVRPSLQVSSLQMASPAIPKVDFAVRPSYLREVNAHFGTSCYYAVLDISQHATREEIKGAEKAALRAHHPQRRRLCGEELRMAENAVKYIEAIGKVLLHIPSRYRSVHRCSSSCKKVGKFSFPTSYTHPTLPLNSQLLASSHLLRNRENQVVRGRKDRRPLLLHRCCPRRLLPLWQMLKRGSSS